MDKADSAEVATQTVFSTNSEMTSGETPHERLKVEVKSSFSSMPGEREQWDAAVLRWGGSVYMTYDWVRTWWEHYGDGSQLRVFTVRSADQVVGLVPVYIQQLGVGPTKLRVARLVGSNIPPKVFDVPVSCELADAVLEAVARHLILTDHCDLISIGPVPDECAVGGTFDRSLSLGNGRSTEVVTQSRDVHTVFAIPESMEEYYASLSKNERKQRRKYERRLLEKEFTVALDVVSEETLVEHEFEQFAVQHAKQWEAEGKTGHFGAWPRGLEYNRALVRAQGKLGRVRFIRIVADGKVICSMYGFVFGSTFFWELPAREIGKEWDRFSLGPTGLVAAIESSMRQGLKYLEGGLAHYEYKLRLGAKEHGVRVVRIGNPSQASRLRIKFWDLVQRVVRLVYHKVWYRRVAPRLPKWAWRPQPWVWLRLDF